MVIIHYTHAQRGCVQKQMGCSQLYDQKWWCFLSSQRKNIIQNHFQNMLLSFHDIPFMNCALHTAIDSLWSCKLGILNWTNRRRDKLPTTPHFDWGQTDSSCIWESRSIGIAQFSEESSQNFLQDLIHMYLMKSHFFCGRHNCSARRETACLRDAFRTVAVSFVHWLLWDKSTAVELIFNHDVFLQGPIKYL